ncbi:MAG: hypothetical protein Q3974_09440 [Rothia sp. (in: high G+C Gram-positive bacteria)]|nr:hypothetical protein [Rothia sp. (in: high G+C Gram-positive bacteria)]
MAAAARAELLMDRYGVLTRGAVALEDSPGGFAAVYRVLSAAEEKGLARRGYFIEGLGAAQFAASATVDRLRSAEESTPADDERQKAAAGTSTYAPVRSTRHSVLLLAATDPANPYGATLPWPAPVPWDSQRTPIKHKPGRKAGAVVILVGGELILYLERGGKTLLPFTESTGRVALAAPLIGQLVRSGVADKIVIETAGGVDVLSSPDPLPPADQLEVPDQAVEHPVLVLRRSLLAAGFYATPRGLRMRKDYS